MESWETIPTSSCGSVIASRVRKRHNFLFSCIYGIDPPSFHEAEDSLKEISASREPE